MSGLSVEELVSLLDAARARAERFKLIAKNLLCQVPECEEPWVKSIGWTNSGTPHLLCEKHKESEWSNRAINEQQTNLSRLDERKRRATARKGKPKTILPDLPALPKGHLDYQLAVVERKIARHENVRGPHSKDELQRLYPKRLRLQKRQFEAALRSRAASPQPEATTEAA
jgi:hypothetical protein